MNPISCPHCTGPHTLSQCPTWYVPTGYRLLPVELNQAIKDVIVETGKCFNPDRVWAEIMALRPAVCQMANPDPGPQEHDALADLEIDEKGTADANPEQ